MKGFKLLAIRPLKNCDSRFRKNLKEGVIYQFYQNFKYLDQSSQRISEKHNNLDSEILNIEIVNNHFDLYTSERNLNISVSAIVGVNGSGKSSIIELFLYLLYKYSLEKQLIPNYYDELAGQIVTSQNDLDELRFITNDLTSSQSKELLSNKGYNSFIPYLADLFQEYEVFPNHKEFNYLELTQDFKQKIENTIQRKIDILSANQRNHNEFINLLNVGLNTEVVFAQNSILNIIRIEDNDFTLYTGNLIKDSNTRTIPLTKSKKPIDLNDFFYSILLNFSHHSLNSRTLGNWINTLFHKNDGYLCPVVINPMRTDGNFDINTEESFSKERLLTNLIYAHINGKTFSFLGDKKNEATKVIFKPKAHLLNQIIYPWEDYLDGSMTIEKHLFEEFVKPQINSISEYELRSIPFSLHIIHYIINKIYRLTYTYDYYKQIKQVYRAAENPIYASQLKNHFDLDKSHTSYKIHRALNYLKQNAANINQQPWRYNPSNYEIEFTIRDLVDICGINKNDSISDINTKIPPSFFDIDIVYSNGVEEVIRFGNLSSGEKHFIFSWQIILYHLNNLESVSYMDKNSGRQSYQSINVILDEVELYMHPEYQRNFINKLLAELRTLRLNGIEHIHILFATHSPFILSDIPSMNILRLEVDENGASCPNYCSDEETFAANIHDLLANDFFLKNGFMGEFSKKTISDLIVYLTVDTTVNNLDLENSEKSNRNWNKDRALKVIELIGEPLIRDRLYSLFQRKFKSNERQILENELKRIQDQLDNLKN